VLRNKQDGTNAITRHWARYENGSTTREDEYSGKRTYYTWMIIGFCCMQQEWYHTNNHYKNKGLHEKMYK
jgi:hypothetical protein